MMADSSPDPNAAPGGQALVKETSRRIRRSHAHWEEGRDEPFRKERELALSLYGKLGDEEKENFPKPLGDWLNRDSLEPFASRSLEAVIVDDGGAVDRLSSVFAQLAEAVQLKWHALDFDEKVFHQVATEALLEAKLHEKIGSEDPARWAAHQLSIPDQLDKDQSFGEPPITIFRGDRFDIDVYYWLDGTTSIHEHGFCGAFGVLSGSSIHSHFDFEETQYFNSRLSLGESKLQTCEMLRVGDVRPIIAGEDLIHALFHLDRPSVSVVVRTAARWAFPQRHFLQPRIALASNRLPDEMRRFHCLNMLARIDHPSFVDDLQMILNTCPPDEFVHLLVSLRSHLGRSDDLSITLNGVIHERRALLKEVIAAIKLEKRTQKLSLFRSNTSDVEERYLLALLLNLPNRELLIEFVRGKWPGEEPEAALERLFRQMFEREAELPFDLPAHEQTASLCARIVCGTPVDSFDPELQATAKKVSNNSIVRRFVGA